MLKKAQDVARIRDGIGDYSRKRLDIFCTWFSYKTLFQVLSAASRVMGIKYSALLALPCFTREVQHLKGRQLGSAGST